MNSSSRNRFLGQTQKAAVNLKPATFRIGDTEYPGAVFHGAETLTNEGGGSMAIDTFVAHIAKEDLPSAPGIGEIITHLELDLRYEIYQVGGRTQPKWIIRAGSFPSQS